VSILSASKPVSILSTSKPVSILSASKPVSILSASKPAACGVSTIHSDIAAVCVGLLFYITRFSKDV
jgi:hypothetical protein